MLAAIYQPLRADSALNEAQTEQLVIERVLVELGWGGDYLPQVNLSGKRREDVPDILRRDWAVGFRDIARATDVHTAIAAVIPSAAAANKLPLLLPEAGAEGSYAGFAPLLLANFNALAFDFVARQKVRSTSMNRFIVEQFPAIDPTRFEAAIGGVNLAVMAGRELAIVAAISDDDPSVIVVTAIALDEGI